MKEFILSYIENETGESTWSTEQRWIGKTEFVGIGLDNQDLQYVSFLIDISPAGSGAYIFHDWYEINYDFVNCSIIKFEEIITCTNKLLRDFSKFEKIIHTKSTNQHLLHIS